MSRVQVGDQVYLKEGGTMFGAVRAVHAHALQIYVENAGDFEVKAEAVAAIHDGKVLLNPDKLGPALRTAISHAHRSEDAR
ncbi:MAG: hypothetical protein ACO1OB_13225 [Archangium sp.]